MRPVKNRKWRKRIRVLCAWALIALLCCPSYPVSHIIPYVLAAAKDDISAHCAQCPSYEEIMKPHFPIQTPHSAFCIHVFRVLTLYVRLFRFIPPVPFLQKAY